MMEDRGKLAERKPCYSRYRLIFYILLLCSFVLLFCLSFIENSSDWTTQWWSNYVTNSTNIRNWKITSHLKQLSLTVDAETINKAVTMQLGTSPEYKYTSPYVVEYPYKYEFIINEPKKCQQLKPFIVLVVPVASQNTKDRHIIRNTWGTEKVVSGKNVALFFLLGLGKQDEKDLLEESKQHGDLIQSNFVDSYKNLTIKTMVMLEWLDTYCSEATYAMKIDSDMFLNLPKLIDMLKNTPKTNYLTGLVERRAIVHRHSDSKWFVPYEIYSRNVYPPYVLGLGYILSVDLAKKLLEASRSVKALYIEDVYLGMCLQHLRLYPTDPPIENAFHVFPVDYNRCTFSRIIATTLHDHTDRLQLWNDFKRPGSYC